MDRPGRRKHGLLPGHYDVPGFARFAHEVQDAGAVIEVEIEIGLHSPVVHVARHGVPNRPRGKLSHADDQLAGLHAFGVDELEDRTFVRCGRTAEVEPFGVPDADMAPWQRLVSRRTEQVEFGGHGRVLGREGDVLAHAGIGHVARLEAEAFAIHLDTAGAADVDGDELAPLEKARRTRRTDGLESQGLVDRHRTADDHAVVVAIGERDPPLPEQIANVKIRTQGIGVHAGCCCRSTA